MAFKTYGNTDRYPPPAPEGIYIGEIISAEESTSKKGNDQWVLKIAIDEAEITDYIPMSAKMAWKMLHLCNALGIAYDGKAAAWECQGKTVRIDVGVQEAEGNYPAKNVVNDYLVSDGTVA